MISMAMQFSSFSKRWQKEEVKGTEKSPFCYIPLKDRKPKPLGDKEEGWRAWKEDTEDYLDQGKPGMKKLLQAVAKKEDLDDVEWWLEGKREYGEVLVSDSHSVELWRTLQTLTEGQPRTGKRRRG